MALKSFFANASNPVTRFFDRKEIRAMESCKEAIRSHFPPEQAQATVELCDKRIAEIQQKHGWLPKP